MVGARLTAVGGGVAACAAELLLAGGVAGGLLFILFCLISKRLGRLRSLLVDVKLFTLTSLLVSGSFGDGGFLAAQCFPNRRCVFECRHLSLRISGILKPYTPPLGGR